MDLATEPSRLSALFVAPECAPLTKTGGLGDVCAALPAALRGLGIDVRVLLPGYPQVLRHARAMKETEKAATVTALGYPVHLLSCRLSETNVPLLVLDCPPLYDRPGGPYQDAQGEDWPDNALRFGLLSRVAALLGSAASPLTWRADIVHCNDWPGGLAPVYLAGEAPRAKTLMTVHNLAFQGNFDAGLLERLELPAVAWSMEGVEFHGRLSFLKGGLACADLLSTVSPTYATEIQAPEHGCGLDGLLRHRRARLHGILNGIDAASWDPSRDPRIARHYDAASLEGKAVNKQALQRRLGLALDPQVPLLGSVGRLTGQKGVDMLIEAADDLAALGQVALLGTGERRFERALREVAARHPARFCAEIGFDEDLAHLIEAGADIFAMPSRYEPCGLNQMYSQRYGTPPLARATGGLADTIEDGVSGFLFREPEPAALLAAARRAVAAYRRPELWRRMQRAAMARNFSWDSAARRYADLYLKLAMLQPA
jgi:starch synthase